MAYSPSTERVLSDWRAVRGGGGDGGGRDPVPAPGPPAAVRAPAQRRARVAVTRDRRRARLRAARQPDRALRSRGRRARDRARRDRSPGARRRALAPGRGRRPLARGRRDLERRRRPVQRAGESRPVRRLVVTAGAARSRPLRLAVRAAVRLRTARQSRVTLVRGELLGGHVQAGGVLVTIQARRGGRWVAVTTLVSNRRGRFHGRLAGASPLRAAVARQPGYPFAAGTSPRR